MSVVADPESISRCVVTLATRAPDSILGALRERFDDVSTDEGRTHLVIVGLDQASVRALLTSLWDVGLSVHAMTWSPSPELG